MKNFQYLILCIFFLATACSPKPESSESTTKEEFEVFSLKNSKGLTMKVTNFGAKVMELWVPDKEGNLIDVVLGYDSISDYPNSPEPYFGAAIGRYGNRIAGGLFELDGKTYQLAKNNGANALHGGPGGFNNVIWKVEEAGPSKIVFSYLSKDGEEGFPGNLKVKMTYQLLDTDEFKIEYEAETDQKTVLNLTHHSFFNLNGAGNESVENHLLQLFGSKYTPVDSSLIPTGELRSVVGTPFDFTDPKSIGKDITMADEQLKFGGGYDHNWVLDKDSEGKLEIAARVNSPLTGISMEVWTTEPGIQFYSGNFLDGSVKGKSGKPYDFRGAFCLETQHFPDSPNQPDFPSTVLNPGQTYQQTCIYKFSSK